MDRARKIKMELTYIVASLVCAFLPYLYPRNAVPFLGLGIALVAEFGLYTYYNRKFYGTVFNYAYIFIALLFVFNFGQVLLLAFMQKEVALMRIVIRYFPLKDALRSLRYINLAFVALSAGTLFWKDTGHKEKELGADLKTSLVERVSNLGRAKSWAIILIALTLPVKVYLDVSFVIRSFTQGFSIASAWLWAYPNFIRAYAGFAAIGVALLIVALQDEPKKQLALLIGTALYLVVPMIGGSRGENVCYLVICALLYLKTREKEISIKQLLLCALACYVLLAVLYTVVALRADENRGVIHYLSVFAGILFGEQSVVFEALREYGNTGYTAMCVSELWLENYLPSFGKSYLFGATAIFPNLTGLPGKLTEMGAFALDLQNYGMVQQEYANIGGSIIGEAFFNFDIVGGVFFCYALGIFIGWVSKSMNKCFRTGEYLKLICYLPVAFACLFWIRDSFGGIVRDAVWGAAFCWLLVYFKGWWKKVRKK